MDASLSSEQHARLLTAFRDGRRTALARAISIVEDERPGFQALLNALFPRLGRAHRIGMTGPPGAGKSTLTAALIRLLRHRDESLGVVAVDPTSPFTGGALLGDRIRMNELATDAGVFIRSMASRGSLGGLAVTTKEIADVMDAFGFDRVFLETVGVGQSELEIAAAADTTVVVLVPESGDSVQAMKAGLMEIADLFVINKADRPGAVRLVREVELTLGLRRGQAFRNLPGRARMGKQDATARGGWEIPVLQTVAEKGDGVGELIAALERHRAWLVASGELSRRRRARLASRVREVVARRLAQVAWQERNGEAILEEMRPALEAGDTTPYEVAERIVRAAMV